MAATGRLRDRLYRQMVARIREDDQSLSAIWRGFEFFHRTFRNTEYPVYYRKRLGSTEEEVLFDVNAQAAGRPFFHLGQLATSPDHRLLITSEDLTGEEQWTLRIREIDSGAQSPEVLVDCAPVVVWASDSQSFWYVRQNELLRPWQLCHHIIGQSVAEDRVVWQEEDEKFSVSIFPDRLEQRLFVQSASTNSTECYWGDLHAPDRPLTLIRKRQAGVEYYPEADATSLYILTNDTGINYRLVTASLTRPEQWEELVAARADVTLEDIELFSQALVVYERQEGEVRVRVRHSEGGWHTLSFPYAHGAASSCGTALYDDDHVRIEYETFHRPPVVYDVNLLTGALTVRRQTEVLGGYDPDRYECRRLLASSHDGVQIPLTVMGLSASFGKPAPVLLCGYGAYGDSEDPEFCSSRLNLLDRGMLYAVAHVRGGGDLGEQWYRAGRLLNKKNSFHDFIACAQTLVDSGVGAADRLIACGASAGGLLVAAALNMRPELFAGALLSVPFVDTLTTMMDPELPLTVTEYDEWGDPADPDVYHYIKSYSPCDNIQAAQYPPQLVLAALNDTRVPYWEAAKWVASVRRLQKGNHPVYLKTDMGQGHGGTSARYAAIADEAFEQAFILAVAGCADGDLYDAGPGAPVAS